MDSTFQPPSATSQPSTRAFVASSSPTPTTDWYLDSAATHHITNNLSNMHLYQPYHSNDQVMVGNGANLPIQNSVKGILPTPSHSFCLNQVLHVPTLTTNLVSVQKFTKDNNCTITFDDSSFLVQDKSLRELCLKATITMAFISSLPLLLLTHNHKLISLLLCQLQLGIAGLVILLLSNFNILLSIYSCL